MKDRATMIQVKDTHTGKKTDYTPTLLTSIDSIEEMLEILKERVQQECPYEAEYTIDGIKNEVRNISTIIKRVADYYESIGGVVK